MFIRRRTGSEIRIKHERKEEGEEGEEGQDRRWVMLSKKVNDSSKEKRRAKFSPPFPYTFQTRPRVESGSGRDRSGSFGPRRESNFCNGFVGWSSLLESDWNWISRVRARTTEKERKRGKERQGVATHPFAPLAPSSTSHFIIASTTRQTRSEDEVGYSLPRPLAPFVVNPASSGKSNRKTFPAFLFKHYLKRC